MLPPRKTCHICSDLARIRRLVRRVAAGGNLMNIEPHPAESERLARLRVTRSGRENPPHRTGAYAAKHRWGE